MIYCEKCGAQIEEKEICPKCGCYSGYTPPSTQTNFQQNDYSFGVVPQEKKPNVVLCILSVLIPIVGIVLFFVKRNESPKEAKTYLILAGCGFAANVLISLLRVFAGGLL